MDAELHRLVRDRSAGRCEYCRLPEADSLVPFEIEHIIPRKHRGRTVAGNLAWACMYCNGYKVSAGASKPAIHGCIRRVKA
jgi:5-methylcytosine-specific restriction endonuclease McrA